MKNSYKAALLAALGLTAATAAQAQLGVSYFGNAADPVLLGLNDGNTLNDYVLNLGNSAQFSTTASLSGSLTSGANTVSSVFGSDANYFNNVNIGLYSGDFNEPMAMETANQAALATAEQLDIAYNANVYRGTSVGVTATSSTTSWNYNMEVSPTQSSTDVGNGVSDQSTGLFMNTAVNGNYSEQVYATEGNGDLPNGDNTVVDLGTLNVNLNSGTWSFSGADAVSVPEPTTYGLLAGAGLLVLSLRRQFVKKNA